LKDNIFENLDPEKASFAFDAKLVPFFDDMVSRSVPCYGQLQQAILLLLKQFLRKGSSFYDLGVSTGTTLSLAFQAQLLEGICVHALDASKEMLDQSKLNLAPYNDGINYHHHHLKNKFSFERSSVILANLTFQFLDPDYRLSRLMDCYNALLPGGALIYVEKVKVKGTSFEFFDDLYRLFKQQQGYSVKEILRKEKSLKGVLQPLEIQQHHTLLKRAGFGSVISFFQYFQFWGMVCIK